MHRLVLLFITISFATRLAAQVPGDGVPDAYFLPTGGFINTSMGLVESPPNSLLFDTDGEDVVALFIGGLDVSTAGCLLCDGMNLPGQNNSTSGASTWTVGYSAGSTQWIRTNPLFGPGFTGVIGTGFLDSNGDSQTWPEDIPPFIDFPDAGVGLFNNPDFCFDPVFTDDNGRMRSILYASDDGTVGFSDITGFAVVGGAAPLCVPESETSYLALIAAAAAFSLTARSWTFTRDDTTEHQPHNKDMHRSRKCRTGSDYVG